MRVLTFISEFLQIALKHVAVITGHNDYKTCTKICKKSHYHVSDRLAIIKFTNLDLFIYDIKAANEVGSHVHCVTFYWHINGSGHVLNPFIVFTVNYGGQVRPSGGIVRFIV